jgi:predicted dehydrogenase
MDRRNFMMLGSTGLSLSMLGGITARAEDQKKYRVGLIGAGWYGKNDLFRLIQVSLVEVVSVCAVDKQRLTEAAEMVAGRQKSRKLPRTYTDYREMLKEKDLDIVIVGTPDHWHSLQTIAAIEAGADVYVQKPISRDILEGEAMVAAARKHKRVVQVGTQRKFTPHIVDAKKTIIDTGMLGKIGHVEICCYYQMRANGNPPNSPVPDFLDYEMWTGPAPLRPYDQIPHER